jgi:hypothetical protein
MPLLFQEYHTLLCFRDRPRIVTAQEHEPALVKQMIISLLLGFQLGIEFLKEKTGKTLIIPIPGRHPTPPPNHRFINNLKKSRKASS